MDEMCFRTLGITLIPVRIQPVPRYWWYGTGNFIAVTFPFQEPVLDPDFDWIALAKRKKLEALEDNRIRFERLEET